MPVYEYRCGVCDTRFELRRSVQDADGAVRCPDGHAGSRRLLSVFAAGGRSEPSTPGAGRAPSGGGGCCAGSCGCG